MATNMNHYNSEPEISLLDYAKKLVIDLMIGTDDEEKANSISKTNFMVCSSESESETARAAVSRYERFERIVDDYLGIKPSSLNKSVSRQVQKDTIEHGIGKTHENHAKMFLQLEKEYLDLSHKENLTVKIQNNQARSLFCKIGHMTLRNANSSSEIERAFNDGSQSCSGKRVKLRSVYNNQNKVTKIKNRLYCIK